MGYMKKLSMMGRRGGGFKTIGGKSITRNYETLARQMGINRRTAGQRVFDITGDKELAKALDQLRLASVRKVMRPAVSKALTPVNRRAKALCPSRRIRRLIGKRVYKSGTAVTGKVYVRKAADHGITETVRLEGRDVDFSVVGNFLEFGTRHARKRSFLRPAMDQQRQESLAILRRECWTNLKKETAKAYAKGKAL